MTDAEILKSVKNALGITGDFQDATLTIYINEVKLFMKDAGVNIETLSSTASVGCIARGVADLWNYGGAEGKLSEYFMQRATQLAYSK